MSSDLAFNIHHVRAEAKRCMFIIMYNPAILVRRLPFADNIYNLKMTATQQTQRALWAAPSSPDGIPCILTLAVREQ